MPEVPPPPPPPPGIGPPKFEVKAQDRIHTTFEPTDQGDPASVARAAIEARESGILDLSGSGLAKFPLGVIKLAGSDVTHIDISNNDLKALPRDFCSFTQGSDEKFFLRYSVLSN